MSDRSAFTSKRLWISPASPYRRDITSSQHSCGRTCRLSLGGMLPQGRRGRHWKCKYRQISNLYLSVDDTCYPSIVKGPIKQTKRPHSLAEYRS